MDNKQLTRLMELAKKTGSPLIVTDTSGGDPVVIMGVDQYEVMMGVDVYDVDDYKDDLSQKKDSTLERYSEDSIPGIEDINSILEEEDDDLGEERFYLEPVE